MPLDFSALEAELANDESVNNSAATLIAALAAEIQANIGNQPALQALVDKLKGQSDALAAAVAATPTP